MNLHNIIYLDNLLMFDTCCKLVVNFKLMSAPCNSLESGIDTYASASHVERLVTFHLTF